MFQSFELQHGSITALGFVVARFLYLQRVQQYSGNDIVIEDVEMEEGEQSIDTVKLLSQAVAKLGKISAK